LERVPRQDAIWVEFGYVSYCIVGLIHDRQRPPI